jgi:hypothetical protein
MVIGALFVASSFSDERCVSVFRAWGRHRAVTRAEIQMPRFDTADFQGWDLLLAGAIWFVRKRETLRVQCLDRIALTRMIGSCRDLKSDEELKLNMFNLVFILDVIGACWLCGQERGVYWRVVVDDKERLKFDEPQIPGSWRSGPVTWFFHKTTLSPLSLV